MKALHTKEYFEKHKTDLFERYKRYCDFEHQLAILLPDFSNLPEEDRLKAEAIVTKVNAKKVVADVTGKLLKDMQMIKDIKEGRASLGYTTTTQEVNALHELNERFEFTCFMLAEFKSKYGIA